MDVRDGIHEFRQAVIISWFEDESIWHAVFIKSEFGQEHQIAQFDGRDDAITWAKERAETVRVQTPGTSQWEYV